MAAVRFITYIPQLYCLYTSVNTHWIWQLSGSLCIYHSYTVCIQVLTHTGYGSCQVHYVYTTAIQFVYKCSHTLDMAAVRFIMYLPQLYCLYTSVNTHWIWQLSGSLCIYHSYTVCIQVLTHTGYGSCQVHYVYTTAILFVYKCSHTLDMAAVRFIMYLPQLYCLYTSVNTHTLDMAAVRFIMYIPQLYCLYTSVNTHWIWQLSGSLRIYHSYTVCIQVFTHTGYGSCQVHYVYTTAILFVYKC